MGKVLSWDITVPYRWTCGEIYGGFLGALKNKKILGIKCRSCEKVYVPPQEVCPACYEDLRIDDFVDVGNEGIVVGFTKVLKNFFGEKPNEEYLIKRIAPANYKEHPLFWFPEVPYAIIMIKLDVADSNFLHIMKSEQMEKLKIGVRVVASWKEQPEGDIFDLEFFKIKEG